jgi:hypothetical protein
MMNSKCIFQRKRREINAKITKNKMENNVRIFCVFRVDFASFAIQKNVTKAQVL